MYDSNNIFAKILEGQIQCNKIYEDDDVLAFHDAFPRAPVHVLVIPKKKYTDYSDFIQNASACYVAGFFAKVHKVVELLGLKSFRLLNNQGSVSGQSVFHFHVHILGGRQMNELI
jgi:diadenosine tetraphosphate (Ap4A) HIT family hydrolase